MDNQKKTKIRKTTTIVPVKPTRVLVSSTPTMKVYSMSGGRILTQPIKTEPIEPYLREFGKYKSYGQVCRSKEFDSLQELHDYTLKQLEYWQYINQLSKEMIDGHNNILHNQIEKHI